MAPYASPFVSTLLGVRGILFGADPIGTFIGGLEGGIRIDIMLGKTSTIRFIPLAVQAGDLFYRQVMMSLLLSL